jgi:hypothetical protein
MAGLPEAVKEARRQGEGRARRGQDELHQVLQGCARPLAHDQGLEKRDIDNTIAHNPVVQNPPSINVAGRDVAEGLTFGKNVDKQDHS